jgi:hypothetical protein
MFNTEVSIYMENQFLALNIAYSFVAIQNKLASSLVDILILKVNFTFVKE